jgi:hypothetical protein
MKKNHKYEKLEKIKTQGEIYEPTSARKTASMINSENQ